MGDVMIGQLETPIEGIPVESLQQRYAELAEQRREVEAELNRCQGAMQVLEELLTELRGDDE